MHDVNSEQGIGHGRQRRRMGKLQYSGNHAENCGQDIDMNDALRRLSRGERQTGTPDLNFKPKMNLH